MIKSMFAMFFLMTTASSRSFLSLLAKEMTDRHFKMLTNLSRTPQTESTLDDQLGTQSFFKNKDEAKRATVNLLTDLWTMIKIRKWIEHCTINEWHRYDLLSAFVHHTEPIYSVYVACGIQYN